MKKMVMERLWKSKLIKLTDKFHITVQLCIFQFLDATYNIFFGQDITVNFAHMSHSQMLGKGEYGLPTKI